MQKNILKFALAFIIAILLGLVLHFVSPLMTLLVLALLLFSGFFSVVLIVIGAFSKKFRIWYVIGLIPIIAAYGFAIGIRNYQHKKALLITAQLELFKKENGMYPEGLNQIKKRIELRGLKYSPDSTCSNYMIEYLMDSFNREYFDSRYKEWGTLGWND